MNKPVIYRDIFSFASVPVFICYWHLVVISLKLNVATNARSVWVKCGPGGSIGDPVQLSPTPIGDPRSRDNRRSNDCPWLRHSRKM